MLTLDQPVLQKRIGHTNLGKYEKHRWIIFALFLHNTAIYEGNVYAALTPHAWSLI